MSKNKLYGNQKWYEYDEKKHKKTNITRKWNNQVILFGKDEEIINDTDFIKKLQEYSNSVIKSANQFIKKNPSKHFLFKIKDMNDYKIIKWEYENKAGKGSKVKTRKEIEEKIKNDYEKEIILSIEFYKFIDKEMYELCKEKNKILYKNQKKYINEVKNLNNKLVEINEILYNVLDSTLRKFSSSNELGEYNWKVKINEYICKKLEEKKIDIKFENIRYKLKENSNLYSNIMYRESKRRNDLFEITVTYVKSYFKSDAGFEIQQIVDYIFNIGKQYLNLEFKHVIEGNETSDKLENTYIKNDLHTKNSIDDKLNNCKYKLLLKVKEDETYIKEKVIEFSNELLDENLVKYLKGFENNRSKKLIEYYKNSYQEKFDNEVEKMCEEERYILGVVYSYIKERIKKYIKNPDMSYEQVFRGDLDKNCKKKIDQKLLEYVFYNGKISHYQLENNINSFQKQDAYEELLIETLLGISDLAHKFIPITEKKEDIFGSEIEIGKLKKFSECNLSETNKNKLLGNECFSYIDKENDKFNEKFKNDFTLIYQLRSEIIHGINPFLFKDSRNYFENLNTTFLLNDNLIKYIDKKYLEIEKTYELSLNLKENLSLPQKQVIKDIKKGDEKFRVNEVYAPTSSKVVKKLSYDIIIGDNQKELEIKNVAKFFIKKIYIKETGYKNSEFYIFYKNELKTKNLETGHEILKKKYQKATSNEAKGMRGSVSKFQNEVVDIFSKYYKEKFNILLDFEKMDLNTDSVDLSNLSTTFGTKNTNLLVQTYTLIGLFVDNKILNQLINKLSSTYKHLLELNVADVEVKLINQIHENLAQINELNKCQYELIGKKINLTKEASISDFEKKKYFENGKFKINEIRFTTTFFENLKYNGEDLKIVNILSKYGIEEFEDKKFSDIKNKIKDPKKINNLVLEMKKIFEVRNNEIELQLYVEFMEKFKSHHDFNNLTKDVYFKTDEETIEFRKNLYKYSLIDEKVRNIIEEEILPDKFVFSNEDYEIYTNKKDKIVKVDTAITVINNRVKGLRYKKYLIEDIQSNFNSYCNLYKNYDEFIEDYEMVSKYKEIDSRLDYYNGTYIYEKLYEINWNFLKFIFRYDRDKHFFFQGLNSLDLINLEDGDSDKSDPEKRYKVSEEIIFRNYFNFKKLEEVDSKNIRNYIAHFYMIRNPFERSILEIGKELEELMSYRSKYQSGVKNSLLYIFKREVNLNYDNMRKYYEFDNLPSKFDNKRVSVLNLECWNKDMKNIIKNMLRYKKDEK